MNTEAIEKANLVKFARARRNKKPYNLNKYVNLMSPHYDPLLAAYLQFLSPHWFRNTSIIC